VHQLEYIVQTVLRTDSYWSISWAFLADEYSLVNREQSKNQGFLRVNNTYIFPYFAHRQAGELNDLPRVIPHLFHLRNFSGKAGPGLFPVLAHIILHSIQNKQLILSTKFRSIMNYERGSIHSSCREFERGYMILKDHFVDYNIIMIIAN